MCFNAEVSIITYITSTLLSLYIFKTGDKSDKTIAIFCLCFCQIQLLEFLLWIDQSCGTINSTVTKLIAGFILLQPASIFFGGLMYNTFNIPASYLRYLFLISLVIVISSFWRFLSISKQLCSTPDDVNKLQWDVYTVIDKFSFTDMCLHVFYFIGLIVPWILFKNKNKKYIVLTVIISSFIISNANFKQWESMWCFLANILPILLIVYRQFK